MQLHLRPGPYRALLFDIDNTLYRDDEYARSQIQVLIERLAADRGESVSDTEELVARTRRDLQTRTGRTPSLGNTFVALGVPIARSVVWRAELIDPEARLERDGELTDMVAALAEEYLIAALTNNPVAVGRRTLSVLGIEQWIPTVIGLDSAWASKPAWEPFALALETLDTVPDNTVMVGDRYDVDLAPMLERGGSGILVESRSDLLSVRDVLRGGSGT